RFMTADGVGEVVDFMPIHDPEHATDNHFLVRLVRVVRGEMAFRVDCEPRFDYGRAKHDVTPIDNGVLFRAPGLNLALGSNVPLKIDGNDVRATWTGQMGDVVGFLLESAPDHAGWPTITGERVLASFNDTVRFWRTWLGRS